MSKILIVDDDNEIAELLSDLLIYEGFDTIIKDNGLEAINEINNNTFDLILMDIMMPELSGIDVIKKIRDKVKCPIIFLTAKTNIIDKLLSFELGVDDYITKPFINEELVARVKAHIRRDNREFNNDTIKIGDIVININNYDVYKNNIKIDLSTREFKLLVYLMKNAGLVLSKEQIFDAVWGSDYNEVGTVAVHIKNLRSKLDNEEVYIKTIWGVGYKFVKAVNS